MAKKKTYHAVKIKLNVNLIVSDEVLERLNNGEVMEIVRKNCFRNNDRSFINEDTTFEEIKRDIPTWNEAWKTVLDND